MIRENKYTKFETNRMKEIYQKIVKQNENKEKGTVA